MAYIYFHYKLCSTPKVFYIGVGGLNKFDNYKRSFDTRKRSKEWYERSKNIPWSYSIVEDNLTKEEALIREKYWINLFGRKDLNNGLLVNLTKGGQGAGERIVSSEQREYLRNKYKGKKRPKEVVDKYVKTRKERNNYKKSQKTKDKIRNSTIGNKNHFYGKKQPKWVVDLHSKIVLNLETGIFYDSIKEACKTTYFSYDYFKSMLNGNSKNKTNFIQV